MPNYSLIVCEKPAAARKIAECLAEGSVSEQKFGKVSALEIERGGRRIVLVSGVGHLFGLVEAVKGKWTYPVLETKWAPIWESNKGADFAKPYSSAIERTAKGANEFYNATDYDVEGAVIGFNILRFLCDRTDARRMKFSTLTKKELETSFENASEHLDFPQVEAGLARHEMDWLYGINLSRALTLAIKKAGRWSILSTGRVQGPALALLAKREREISSFRPVPFFEIELHTRKKSEPIVAKHSEDKIWDRKRAEEILAKTSGEKETVVSSLERKEYSQAVPTPFDLTKLQTESYRHFGFAPSLTQKIAQSLYEKALISYPRTSSQKLPEQLGLREILVKLAGTKKYGELAARLASKPALRPAEGEKTDPAHPAIHPTGEKPKALTEPQEKVYDLIVRRFLAVFGDPARRESLTAEFDVRGEKFLAVGRRTVERGWMEYYGPYAKFEEETLPELKKGEKLPVDSIDLLAKETEPPPRYNEASLVKELEKENLGTKATRAEIVQTLYSRGYIREKKIQVTDLGMAVVGSLEKNVPRILSPELTREFESSMEGIVAGTETREKVLASAKKILVENLDQFRNAELEIGQALLKGLQVSQKEREELGKCNKCGQGTLKIIFNPKTRKKFVGCSNYPKCSNSFPLPMGLIEPTGKICEKCNTPIVKVVRAGKRPFQMCLEMKCETKKDWGRKKQSEPKGEARSGSEEKDRVKNKGGKEKPPVEGSQAPAKGGLEGRE